MSTIPIHVALEEAIAIILFGSTFPTTIYMWSDDIPPLFIILGYMRNRIQYKLSVILWIDSSSSSYFVFVFSRVSSTTLKSILFDAWHKTNQFLLVIDKWTGTKIMAVLKIVASNSFDFIYYSTVLARKAIALFEASTFVRKKQLGYFLMGHFDRIAFKWRHHQLIAYFLL